MLQRVDDAVDAPRGPQPRRLNSEPSMCIVTLKTGAYEDLIAHIHNCCAFSLTINKLNFHMIMEGERLLKQDK